jgi:hypothetical protein
MFKGQLLACCKVVLTPLQVIRIKSKVGEMKKHEIDYSA